MKKPMIVFLVCLSLLTACRAKAEYHIISAADAYKIMSESNDFILLDVRTEEEFNEQRIEGAVLIPHQEIKARAQKELPDKKRLILVYCRSGGRSILAAGELVSLGYTNVFDLGGIINWPYQTISD